MAEIKKLKLFICYSHLDEHFIKEFDKHLSPLKNNGSLETWYDRKIIAGQDYQDTIDNNLDKADIICLCISANFLSSTECMKEKNTAVKLSKKKGVVIIPIILSACGWKDDKELASLLALPTDGKPISDFGEKNNGWKDVYDGLKAAIQLELKMRTIKIKSSFLDFLNSTELLTKAHSQKESVVIDDIFVYPELLKYDEIGEYDKKESAEKLIDNFFDCSKILIEGEDQSGKTTLCKKLFIELRERNFLPVYITIKTSEFQATIESRIKKSFEEQYEYAPLEEINKKMIIPIVDNFHFSKKKEKFIEELTKYCHQILIVDNIFRMNFKNEGIIKEYSLYKIKEFNPHLRNELIKKWLNLSDKKDTLNFNINHKYQNIDKATELVNGALGKLLGTGIMPSYPFFVLSVLSTYETFDRPLDQEITSQGHCYQALIFLALRKQGVKNDDIDTYINFLTEFAFYLFKEEKFEVTPSEFEKFMKKYLSKYNLPIPKDTLLNKLDQARILCADSCNNFSFFYQYIYYYFVAKFIAEHSEEYKDIIDNIIQNLHKNEFAYIAVFISHHSKNIYLLDQIIFNAHNLFKKYTPATLNRNELKFFDEQVDYIINEVLPDASESPEMERSRRLELENKREEIEEREKQKKLKNEEEDNEIAIELRRSIKTVEVMGRIIKNRAGSLEKDRLEKVFEEGMKVHLRILTSFFDLIKKKEGQEEIIRFISGILSKIIKEMDKEPNEEKMEKLSRIIFWNVNYSVVFKYINEIIHALGSSKLLEIIEDTCNKVNTPASFLVKHGIFMWYAKNLQIENISKKISDSNFSETSKKIMRSLIVNHSSMHLIDYKDKQKIEAKLGIPTHKLLLANIKKSEE